MKHIPRILNCAAVKVFAVLETATPPVSRPMVSQIAVCRRSASPLFAVFYCDAQWQTLHSELFDSMDHAIGHAQQDYPELTGKWLSPQAAVILRESEKQSLYCAFCGETFTHTSKLVTGEHASICHHCLSELYLQHHRQGQFAPYQDKTDVARDRALPSVQ